MIYTIPSQHSPRTLIGTLEWLKADSSRTVLVRGIWPEQQYNYNSFLSWFRKRLAEKINRNIPVRGRKDCADWQRHTRLFAQKVNTPRLIVRETEAPFEFRERLQHRFFEE